MPKVTLTFVLPEESSEHADAIHGADWKSIVYETTVFLRNALKHGHEYKTADDALEAVRKEIWDLCNDSHLDPWEN